MARLFLTCIFGLPAYFFASIDLLMHAAGAKLLNNDTGCSDGIIADGCSAPSTIEPLFAIEAANVLTVGLDAVADDDDDAELTFVLVKRTGTSSVKCSSCGK
jgi:hypothetical protein